MKYMGSKRAMLRNGLGELLAERVPTRARFFDLFCGTGSVGGHVAQRYAIPVHACDLQTYAVTLAASQIEQTQTFDSGSVFEAWAQRAADWLSKRGAQIAALRELSPSSSRNSSWRKAIEQGRALCEQLSHDFPITHAYGGYYFSPMQALCIDALRATLPLSHKVASLASLIDAASSCAAAPGHTAQPFGTNDSALPHLASAWSRDVSTACATALARNSSLAAKAPGTASRSDALTITESLNELDVAFIDPPYSEVQYSRFYHVLESIAQGEVGPVAGTGRYPRLENRPQSKFCRLTQSAEAFNDLMVGVAATGAEAIVTFPASEASNGMSGVLVEAISDQYFHVKSRKVTSLFSTLGGNAVTRNARKPATELVLYLSPR